ncbi:MAG: L-rhamnose mutarotase [Woeseiaceae bacterium]
MNSAPRQYCLTLNLRDDQDLIREYEELHRPGNVWPEIIESIRSSGIQDMQIYRSGVRLVMVLTVTDDFSFERKAKTDSENPKVVEWERLMEKFQRADESGDSKWKPMKNIFNLQEHS